MGKKNNNGESVKRNPNWSKVESKQLLSEVAERNHILKASHGALDNAESKKKKAWEEISNGVSSISPYGVRSVEDCKTRLSNVLRDATKKAITYNRELNKTGEYKSHLILHTLSGKNECIAMGL